MNWLSDKVKYFFIVIITSHRQHAIFKTMQCRRGRDRRVVGLTSTCAVSAYHNCCCEFESLSWRDVLDTTLCDKVCQ